MKAKINIELWDNFSMEQLSELGLTEKFLKIMYEKAFEQLVEEICTSGVEYSLSVEIEDNTKQ